MLAGKREVVGCAELNAEPKRGRLIAGSSIHQRNHEAVTYVVGVADKRVHGRVGTLAGLEFRECGAVHAGEFGQVGKAQAFLFACDFQLQEQLLQLV